MMKLDTASVGRFRASLKDRMASGAWGAAHRLARAPMSELLGFVMALSAMLALLAAVQFHALRTSMLTDLGAAADLIAQNAKHAIVLEDDNDAQALLNALTDSSTVVLARLHSLDGRLLAVHESPQQGWCRDAVLLQVSRPVIAYGKPVGELVLVASSCRLVLWSLVFLGVGALAVAGAWFVSWLSARRAALAAAMAQQSLSWMSKHDPLTGCSNRDELRAYLLRALAAPQPGLALLLVDIDEFGVINAAYGAHQGDAVLRVIAQRLQAMVGGHDCLARISADEFALALHAAGEESVHAFALRVQAAISEPIFIGDVGVRASACVGVAVLPSDGSDVAAALSAASAALGAARMAGQGGVSRYEASQERELRERTELTEALRKALARGELSLHYQPICSIGGRQIRSAEALIRWTHPTLGSVSPDKFIPLAESAGLIEELGLQILGRLQRDRMDWLGKGLSVPPVAVNLSALQFVREGSKAAFLDRLEVLGLTPDVLEIELTERAAFEQVDSHDSIISSLKRRGYAIALDDFGTGYSSLSYLHRINCDKLKIDRSFVRRMDQQQGAQQLVKAIAEVAQAFGLKTVAEGVETEGELEALRRAGCDFVQGYLLDKPMNADHFAGRLLALTAQSDSVAGIVE